MPGEASAAQISVTTPFPISAIVITRNEEDHIASALATLEWAAEIVVVDSHSTDRTAEIARRFTPRVFSHEFAGYGAQYAFAQSQCRHDWVFWLDADERVTPELAAAIRALPAAGGADAYRIARRTWYFDRWIRHSGWYPDYQVRLYRRAVTEWTRARVHAAPRVAGRVATLAGGDLLHHTRRSLREHIEVLNRYTDLAADELPETERAPSLARLSLAPAWTWLRSYLLRQGFRDGLAGFLIAGFAGFYVFAREAKRFERKRSPPPPHSF